MENLLTEWARLVVASLADAGIQDVVVSPGSRSTPFVLQASRHADLRLVDVVDERSAAFFALGQARVTGRPSLLICTSGTAGANYLPAVVEAGMSHLPLVVLTADRPLDLLDCGANQTIDQVELFGRHARRFVDLGEPSATPRALRALRRRIARAVWTSREPEPGAVHLNARAAKPLEPREPSTDAEHALRRRVDDLLERPMPRPAAAPASPGSTALDELAAALDGVRRGSGRGLLVAGPAPLAQGDDAPAIFELARRTGFPILADATSQLRFRRECPADVAFIDTASLLLANAGFRLRHRPDLILQIGRAPTATAWQTWLEEMADDGNDPALAVAHFVLSRNPWHDPASTASHLLLGDLGRTLELLLERLPAADDASLKAPSAWSQVFRDADRCARKILDDDLTKTSELSEGAVAHDLADALSDGALLAIGNSLPIRHLDLDARAGGKDLGVLSQRGASGIDGITSGALGAAAALYRDRPRQPMALLVGDVGFLHDLSGLAAARHVESPFALVVLNNGGGRIFEMLPLASHDAARGKIFEHWTTPHALDIGHAARAFALPFVRVLDRDALRDALDDALAGSGVTVIEAVAPPHGAIERRRRLASRFEAETAKI